MKLEELKIEYNQEGSSRVLRGGSWFFVASIARAARRDFFDPDYRFFNFGFRIVRFDDET